MHHLKARLIPAAVLGILIISCGQQPGTGEQVRTSSDSLADGLSELDRRIVADARNAGLYADRARWYVAHGRSAEAIEDWKRALSIDSSNAGFHVALGDLYYQGLKIQEAQAEFDRAMKLDPASNDAKLKAAEIQMVLRQYERSMTLVNEVLRSDPNLAQGYFLKGWIHMETGDTALAISSFRTCVEQDPAHYKAYMELGVLHARKHDPLALQYYNTAIELRPKEVEAWYNKGLFAQENSMDSIALACYDRIKELDLRNATAWYNSGFVHLEHLNDPRKAVGQFTAAGKLLPGYFQAFYNRGVAYERLGVLDSAAMDYQHALSVRPDYDPAAEGLTRLQRKGLRIARPQ